MTWTAAVKQAGCSCPRSDAWRCAVEVGLPGRIACHCTCHKYLRAPDPAPAPLPVTVALEDLCAMSHLVMAATRRDFADGREAMVMPQLYNARITVGPAGTDWFDDSW